MDDRDSADLIIEALEVFIHQILYLRNVYPSKIFEPKKAYNSPVFISIYPKLNDYICNVLKTAKALIDSRHLRQIEIILYHNNKDICESYLFEIGDNPTVKVTDSNLINLEENIRKSLLLLANRMQLLKALGKDCKFKIYLHTTQSEFVKISNDPKYQEFPWLQETVNSLPGRKEIQILPVTTIKSFVFKICATSYY